MTALGLLSGDFWRGVVVGALSLPCVGLGALFIFLVLAARERVRDERRLEERLRALSLRISPDE